jgi:uncharacterized protein with PIN domain
MKFVVDGMLGKLAKWLKILGFDVAYDNKAEDSALVRLARKQGCVLLTRDVRLQEEAGDIPSLFIESEKWQEQVEQVLGDLNLQRLARPYSRCISCNIELKNLPKKKAKNLVAPFILERAASFAICPECGRVFWPGTHFEDMDSKLAKILRKKGNRAAGKKSKHKPPSRNNRIME